MGSHQKTLGIKDLVIELEDTARIHREIARVSLGTSLWYNKLGGESQEHLADLGRHLLNLIIRCVIEPSNREETIRNTAMGFKLSLKGVLSGDIYLASTLRCH